MSCLYKHGDFWKMNISLFFQPSLFVGSVWNASTKLLLAGTRPDKWHSHLQIVGKLWICFGLADVDLFATAENTHCPKRSSMHGQPGSLGTWPFMRLHAFPPFPLLLIFLRMVRTLCTWAFLVVPNWPQRPAVIDKNEMLRSHLLHFPEVIITKVQGQDHLPPEPF